MKRLRIALALTAAVNLQGCATEYGATGLFHLKSYTDKEIAPDVWKVESLTTQFNYEGEARDAVLYRAAEIAAAKHHAMFQVLEATNFQNLLQIGYGCCTKEGESAKLVVHLADTEQDHGGCKLEKPEYCRFFDAQAVMDALRSRLRITRPPTL